MNYVLFYIVILLANIVQGITGFAGTILAMPFSMKLVGMETAVPVLNALGLLSGIYVFAGNYRHVVWKELGRVIVVMGLSVAAGIVFKTAVPVNPQVLYYVFGVIVLAIAVSGLRTMFRKKTEVSANGAIPPEEKGGTTGRPDAVQYALLIAAGLIHGMFVCGGPLLIGYLTKRIKDKAAFRATISVVWIFLNGIILISQLITGAWTLSLLKVQLISLPFLIAGMFIGGLLYKRMSQRFFMLLTYILLIIAGISLFFK